MKEDLALFEGHQIRRVYDEKAETWLVTFTNVLVKEVEGQERLR